MTRLTGAADRAHRARVHRARVLLDEARARLRDRDPQAAPDTLVLLRRVAALRALTGGA